MITITLFYYCKKVFILINKWMIGKTLLPEKKDFYSHLNMEHTTDTHYAHVKRVCKDFEIKNVGEYHDLHV